MTMLDIERLHTEYHVDQPETAARLEQVMDDLVSSALEIELVGESLTDAYAVCIPALRVRFDVGSSLQSGDLSCRWAQVIFQAIRDQIDSGQSPVLYRREIDAHVDMIRSIAAQRFDRAWVWKRLGLVATSAAPTLRHAIVAIANQPGHIPAVLLTCGSDRDVFDLAAWTVLAIAFSAVSKTVPFPTLDPNEKELFERPPVTSAGGSRVETQAVAVASFVPAEVWAELPREVQPALIQLAIACTAPTALHDREVAAAIAAYVTLAALDPDQPTWPDHESPSLGRAPAATSSGVGSELADPALAARDQTMAVADTASGEHQTRTDSSPGEPQQSQNAAEEPSVEEQTEADAFDQPLLEGHHSEHGGLLLLVHAVTAIDPFADVTKAFTDRTELVARSLAQLANASLTDPAVVAASGWRFEVAEDAAITDSLSPQAQAEVHDVAAAIDQWVSKRLTTPMPLHELIERHTMVIHEPGWIQATYSLDSVDLRLRVAGLDLDPGYVWWLGSVVRFRYE